MQVSLATQPSRKATLQTLLLLEEPKMYRKRDRQEKNWSGGGELLGEQQVKNREQNWTVRDPPEDN